MGDPGEGFGRGEARSERSRHPQTYYQKMIIVSINFLIQMDTF